MPSDYETRTRSFSAKRLTYSRSTYGQTVYTSITGNADGKAGLEKKELVYSRRNGWHGRPTDDRDLGGDFLKKDYIHQMPVTQFDISNSVYHYWGSWVPNTYMGLSDPFNGLPASQTAGELAAWGTRHVADTSPTAPKAGLTTALVELKREGLPSFASETYMMLANPGKRRNFKKLLSNVGGDYLNVQFGWVPFLSDIQSTLKSVIKTDELLTLLYRDNGRLIRRSRGRDKDGALRYFLVSEDSVDSAFSGSPVFPTSLYASSAGGRAITTTKVERARWFSGAFMYHLPEDVGSLGTFHKLAVEARYLYGLSLTPIDAWNLLPWSWLLDWFSNFGSVISTVSDQIYNGQVLKYGYEMCHTRKYITRDTFVPLASGVPLMGTSVQYWSVKQRQAATPFGFGITWDGFTPSQLAILSSLGLARLR